MQRIIVSVVALAVIAMLGLPPVFGMLAERRIKQQLADSGDGENFTVRLERYQRGWYFSSAMLRVRPTADYLLALEETLSPIDNDGESGRRSREEMLAIIAEGCDFDVNIEHGPLVFQSEPFFGFAQVQALVSGDTPKLAEMQKVLEAPYLLSMTSLIGFSGNTQFFGDVPELGVKSSEMALAFSGLDFEGIYDVHRDALGPGISLSVTAPSVAYRDTDVDLTIEGMALDFDGSLLQNNLWVGNVGMLVGELLLARPGGEQEALFKLEQLNLSSDTSLNDDGDQIATKLVYSLRHLGGHGLPRIDNAHIGVELAQLDLSALQHYVLAARALGVASDDELAMASAEFADVVHRLLAGAPTMVMDPVTFTVDGDNVNANLNLVVEPSMLPPAAQLFTGDPASWAGLFTGSGRFAVTEALFYRFAEGLVLSRLQASAPAQKTESAEQMQAMAGQQSRLIIAGLLQQGMLTVAEGNIVSELTYGAGALTINGTVVPLR